MKYNPMQSATAHDPFRSALRAGKNIQRPAKSAEAWCTYSSHSRNDTARPLTTTIAPTTERGLISACSMPTIKAQNNIYNSCRVRRNRRPTILTAWRRSASYTASTRRMRVQASVGDYAALRLNGDLPTTMKSNFRSASKSRAADRNIKCSIKPSVSSADISFVADQNFWGNKPNAIDLIRHHKKFSGWELVRERITLQHRALVDSICTLTDTTTTQELEKMSAAFESGEYESSLTQTQPSFRLLVEKKRGPTDSPNG